MVTRGVRKSNGFAAALLARIFAALLVFSFLVPTVSQAEATNADRHPYAHAFELATAGDVDGNGAHGACCLECPLHAWYRQAEAPITATKRFARRVSFAFIDETASSSDVYPPSKPPRA